MTLEEERYPLSGKDFRQSRSINRLGIGNMTMPDGFHGIRKQEGAGNQFGLNGSLPATCFPTAAAIANSWDPEPWEKIGRALEEAVMMFYRLLKNPNVAKTVSFTDMNGGEWYAEAVYTLASLGVIQGYADGAFHGNDAISRAAFAAIAVRLANADGEAETGVEFSDVPANHWAHDTIARASGYGWIGCYANGTFNPSAPITRAAVTAIINRMLNRNADKEYGALRGTEPFHGRDRP